MGFQSCTTEWFNPDGSVKDRGHREHPGGARSTWIMERQNDTRFATDLWRKEVIPQLAEKTVDSGAGPETFANSVTKPVASRSALA